MAPHPQLLSVLGAPWAQKLEFLRIFGAPMAQHLDSLRVFGAPRVQNLAFLRFFGALHVTQSRLYAYLLNPAELSESVKMMNSNNRHNP